MKSFVSDGASVNLGRKSSIATMLEEFVGHPLVKIHCMAHKLNLAVRKSFTDKNFKWIFYIESLLKQVYVFFMNKGHKCTSFLREAMGGEKITFGGNYETRWAASEKKAVKVIINHHGKIVKALEDLSMDTSFRPEVRQTAVGLVKQLSNKNVMLIFYFFYDVLDVIETSSLQFQKRYTQFILDRLPGFRV